MNTREAAQAYISRGWYPLPLKKGTKDLKHRDGLKRIYVAEEFEPDDNIGLQLISSRDSRSTKLVAVDFDAPEIDPEIIWAFMPRTVGWGRESKPISQLLYISPFERPLVIKDETGTIIEIRAEHQSMCPPSVHPNGEEVKWISDETEAVGAKPADLKRAVNLVATTVVVARHYPPEKARHFWGLYLAGFLRSLGINDEECATIFRLAGQSAGDKHIKDRIDAVRSTYARPEDDPVAGAQKLEEETGDKELVAVLRKVWGAGGTGFITTSKGDRIAPNNQENIRRALQKLDVKLAFDEFSLTTLISRGDEKPHRLSDIDADQIWLDIEKKFSFQPRKDYYDTVLSVLAHEKIVHPVREYLEALEWDGKPRIDKWLVTYGGARDSEYVRAVGALVLVAAVRRVKQPGCKFDEMLVLESPQGYNKSTALRTLCPNEEWFSDDLPLTVDSKQVIERTLGKWVIEAAELVGGTRAADHVKSLLARPVDGPVRLAYARHAVEVKRQFVIVGTTNKETYLYDPTGLRRFWPVKVRRFDVEAIKRDRDQMWAEAVRREATKGTSIRLPERLWESAGSEQEERRLEDPWEEIISEKFSLDQDWKLVSRMVWNELGVDVERRNEAGAKRLSRIMQRLGFRKKVFRIPKEQYSYFEKHGVKTRTVKGWVRDATQGSLPEDED